MDTPRFFFEREKFCVTSHLKTNSFLYCTGLCWISPAGTFNTMLLQYVICRIIQRCCVIPGTSLFYDRLSNECNDTYYVSLASSILSTRYFVMRKFISKYTRTDTPSTRDTVIRTLGCVVQQNVHLVPRPVHCGGGTFFILRNKYLQLLILATVPCRYQAQQARQLGGHLLCQTIRPSYYRRSQC